VGAVGLARLERNRASARLRRLRKKSMTEAYEQEVAAMEANLKRLKDHEWGSGVGGPALLATLGEKSGPKDIMCRGGEPLLTT
jgi:hypothetical protein